MFETTNYKLSDVINLIGGGTPKRSNPDYWEGSIPWLSVADFNSDDRFIDDASERITEKGLNESSTKLLEAGQIIISARGTVGALAQLTKPMAFNQSCYGIDGKAGIAVNDFLYYLLKQKVKELQAKTHGAVFDTITRETFNHINIEIPSIENQIAIAKILGDLDKKIQLNRQINKTLEQIAQAIFKSWFVDFEPVKAKIQAKQNGQDPERAAMRAISGKTNEELDKLSPEQRQQLTTTAAFFPDELEDSELGEIPKGWSVKSMKDLAEKITKGTTPRKPDVLNADDPAVIPFIKVKDITDEGVIIRGGLELIPTSIHENALKRSILKTDDLLFSIAGTIGRVSIVETDLDNSNTNQAVAFVRLRDVQNHLELCHQALKSKRTQDEIASKVVQGVQANASLANIGDIKIIVPSQTVLDIWNQTIKPISAERRSLSGQIRMLSQVRDSLLQKLLSGEIAISIIQSKAGATA